MNIQFNENENEKSNQWFVLRSGVSTGPINLDQVHTQILSGELTGADYVWHPKMSQWEKIESCDVFNLSLFCKTDVPFKSKVDAFCFFEELPIEPVTIPLPRVSFTSSYDFLPSTDLANFAVSPPGVNANGVLNSKRKLIIAITCLIAAAIGLIIFKSASPFADLNLSIDGLRAANHVTRISLDQVGPRAEIVRSQVQQKEPILYIFSNLEDGAKLRVSIRGVSETLLGRNSIEDKIDVSIQNHFAQVQPFIEQDSIPRGEYNVEVDCLSCITGGTDSIAKKNFFMGGIQNQDYEKKLVEFHKGLKEQASTELEELRQITGTIENQLSESLEAFRQIKSSSRRKVLWEEFESQWVSLQQQLNAMIDARKSDAKLYYQKTYQLLVQLNALVVRVHEDQALQIRLPAQKATAASHAEDIMAARGLILTIKEKVATLSREILLSAGLPPSDGASN